MDAEQPVLCSCYRNVCKAAFFFKLIRESRCLRAGEDALLESRKEHDREFKSLCTVNRHQHDCVVFVVVIVDIRDESDLFKEVFKGCRAFFVRFLKLYGV